MEVVLGVTLVVRLYTHANALGAAAAAAGHEEALRHVLLLQPPLSDLHRGPQTPLVATGHSICDDEHLTAEHL